MTAPGGGDPYRERPGPWQPPYRHPPVDPQAPLDYPDHPYPLQPPPYGYGGPPPYQYDPYGAYPPRSTNSLAVASLVTAIAGVVLGIPLALFCYIGWLIPIVAAVLGVVALNQIKLSGQPGRGMALAGIIVGSVTAGALMLVVLIVAAAAFHSPMFFH